MRWKNVWPAAVLAVALAGLALLPAPSQARADEARPDAAKIDKLIEQLGSDAFKEREEATKALDALGEPAFDKLKEAAKNSTDAEIRKRATGLVAKIGTRVGSSRVLAARRVHLVYKDTPLKDAVADFAKQSGYAINVADPENKLKDRKVTLDTGKTTFWDALEKFNAAAGLTEGNPVPPPVPGGFPGGGVFPGGAPGAAPVPAPAPAPGAVKKLLEAIKEREKKLRELEKPAVDPKKPGDTPDSPVALVFPAEDKPAVAKPVGGAGFGGGLVGGGLGAIGGVGGLPGMALPPGAGGMGPGFGAFQPGVITLTPGKADALPADTRTSVRVRVAPDGARAALGPAAGGKLTIALQAAPEPRLRWQQLLSVTIDRAIDDNEQKLAAAKVEAPPAPPGIGGGFAGGGGLVIIRGPIGGGMPGGLRTVGIDGLNHTFPVVLEKGAKESKKLTVLEGSLTARFLGEATPYVEVKDVMKAKGKTVKGDKGGAITVNSVEKAGDGTIQIAFEFEAPADIVAETGAGVPGGMMMPGIGVMPAVPAIAVPAPAPAPPAVKPVPPAADKPADKPAPKPGVRGLVLREEKPPVIKVEIAVPPGGVVIGGGGGVAIGGPIVIGGPGMPFPGGGFAVNGLTLQDDKGKTLPATIQPDWKRLAGGGPAPRQSYIAVYRPQPGQPAEPSKLVFTGRATSDVTVPFKLENVDVK